ncbi:hypothetical protein PJO47_29350, partial [Mycobacterium kansasii]
DLWPQLWNGQHGLEGAKGALLWNLFFLLFYFILSILLSVGKRKIREPVSQVIEKVRGYASG